jgi:RNA polymerase sigma factor (sigma-70 family)
MEKTSQIRMSVAEERGCLAREVIRKFRAGTLTEDEEIEALFTLLRAPIVVHLRIKFDNSREEIEDVFQLFMMRFVEKQALYDLERPLFPYLRTMADRVAIDYFRTNSLHRKLRRVNSDPGEDQSIQSDGGSHVRHIEQAILMEETLKRELSPQDREIFTLKYLEGLTFDQIAESLSLPASTVNERIRTAKARLARRKECR